MDKRTHKFTQQYDTDPCIRFLLEDMVNLSLNFNESQPLYVYERYT